MSNGGLEGDVYFRLKKFAYPLDGWVDEGMLSYFTLHTSHFTLLKRQRV
jgi:hypothetical protein